MKLTRRRLPPPDFSDIPPNYPPGYLEHRRREYLLFDQLPAWARKVLRRTKNEYQVSQIWACINRGIKPLDIINSLEECERVLSKEHLNIELTKENTNG